MQLKHAVDGCAEFVHRAERHWSKVVREANINEVLVNREADIPIQRSVCGYEQMHTVEEVVVGIVHANFDDQPRLFSFHNTNHKHIPETLKIAENMCQESLEHVSLLK